MKIAKNYLFNLTYEILILITPLVLTPYISRVLHAEGIGAYSVSSAVVSYFALVGVMGLDTYGYREIAYVRDDEEKTRRTFWEINIVRFVLVTLSILAYVGFVLITIEKERQLLYLAQVILLAASLFDISWLFVGLEEFKKTTIRNIIVKIISVALVFILVKSEDDLVIYTVIITGSSLFGQLVMWPAVPKAIKKFSIDKHHLFYHLKRAFRVWIPSVAIQIYASLDKVMLGFMDSERQVGLYDNSQKIVRMASAVTTSLASVLVPRMSNLYSNNNKAEFAAVAEKALRFVSCIAIPLCFGIIAIRNTIVPWFYGPGFEEISGLLMVSSWLVITLSWSGIFGRAILLAVGKERTYTFAVVVGAVLNLILNMLLIRKYQATGAIIASVATEYVGMFIMMIAARKYISLKNVFRKLPVYFGISVIMAIGCFYLGEYLGATIWSTVIQIVAGMVFYFIALVVIKDENFTYLYGIIKSKLHR